MTVKQIIFISTLTTYFGIEVQTTGGETACFENFIHHQRILFHTVRELVGVPAQLRIATVGVDRTEQAKRNGGGYFMMERVTCQRRVVSFNVQFNLFFQTKLFQEAIDRRSIVIILMFGRFLRFRFDKQRPLETDFMFMLNHHLHKAAQLFTLLTQVGI